MTSITILSLILGSATSFVGLMLALRSFINATQRKAVEEAKEKDTLKDLIQRVEKLEAKERNRE
jgi:hypothetical protein